MTSFSIGGNRKSTLKSFSLGVRGGIEGPTASQLVLSVQLIPLAKPTDGLTSNTLGGTSLARGDHDEHLHQAVIDIATTALNDEDILVSNRRRDTDRSLSIAEFS